jgi:uncharacterized protein (DUF1778 family)|tara:strand:+ start:204 stop:386 length:183 start_codon:yes stop_codon:yes gene_type:complete
VDTTEKRPRGNPHWQAPEGGKRTHRIVVRVNTGERGAIRAQAAAAGLSVSDYLRGLALRG